QMSYRELNRRANQLANYLRGLGVGPEGLVGVRMDRSARLIVALLGIVKTGGAYLPLDLSYPQERVAFMLTDAKAPVLLTEKDLLASAQATDARVVCLDEHWAQFAVEIQSKKISVMFLTTALFNQIARDAPRAFSSVRQLMFGGEACDPNWVREVLKQGPPQRLLHVYGPTESTTFSTWHLIESVPDDAVTVPIGRPLSNTETYIVDQYFNPVPVGVPGDLYLGGDGLARDYLNRTELTAERFVANPFSEDPTARLYKTGDIARYLSDG